MERERERDGERSNTEGRRGSKLKIWRDYEVGKRERRKTGRVMYTDEEIEEKKA